MPWLHSSLLLQPYLVNIDNIFFTFTIAFFAVNITHWIANKFWENAREQFPKKAQISQWLRYSQICYSKIGPKKLGGEKKRKEDTIRHGCQCWNTSERAASRSIGAMQQFVKSLNDESSDEEEDMMVLPAEFVPLDRTDGEMWRLGSMRYIWWIYLPKVPW